MSCRKTVRVCDTSQDQYDGNQFEVKTDNVSNNTLAPQPPIISFKSFTFLFSKKASPCTPQDATLHFGTATYDLSITEFLCPNLFYVFNNLESSIAQILIPHNLFLFFFTCIFRGWKGFYPKLWFHKPIPQLIGPSFITFSCTSSSHAGFWDNALIDNEPTGSIPMSWI